MFYIVKLTEGPSYDDPNHFVEHYPSDVYKVGSTDTLVVPAEHIFNGKAELDFTPNGEKVVDFLKQTPSFVKWSFGTNARSADIMNDQFYHGFVFTQQEDSELFRDKFGGEFV